MRFSDLVESDLATLDEYAGALAGDQVLAAKALRLANSAAYGRAGGVASLRQAIEVVGVQDLRAITITSALFSSMGGRRASDKEHWKHASITAALAKDAAGAIGMSQSKAFISGLLHSIGVLVMGASIPKALEDRGLGRDERFSPLERVRVEREAFGFDHANIGAEAMRRWGLPNDISTTIELYPDARLTDKMLAGVLNWASGAAAEAMQNGCFSEVATTAALQAGVTSPALESWQAKCLQSAESILECVS